MLSKDFSSSCFIISAKEVAFVSSFNVLISETVCCCVDLIKHGRNGDRKHTFSPLHSPQHSPDPVPNAICAAKTSTFCPLISSPLFQKSKHLVVIILRETKDTAYKRYVRIAYVHFEGHAVHRPLLLVPRETAKCHIARTNADVPAVLGSSDVNAVNKDRRNTI